MIACEMIYMTKMLINKMPSWRGRGLTTLDLHLNATDRWKGQRFLLRFLGALCLIWRSLLKSKSNFLLTDNYQWQRRWQQQQQTTQRLRPAPAPVPAPATLSAAPTTTSTNNNHNNCDDDDDSLIWLGRPRDFTHEATVSGGAESTTKLAFKFDYTLEWVTICSGLY